MGNKNRKVIYCPNKNDHPKKKILLILSEDVIGVHCPDHGWIEMEFYSNGQKIDFSNLSIKLLEVPKNTNYILDEVPAIAIGSFERKKKR